MFPSNQMFAETLTRALDTVVNTVLEVVYSYDEGSSDAANEVSADGHVPLEEAGSFQAALETSTTRMKQKVPLPAGFADTEKELPSIIPWITSEYKSQTDGHPRNPEPDLIRKDDLAGMGSMVVRGKRMRGHYNPLSRDHLKQKLLTQPNTQRAKDMQHSMVEEALSDIEAFSSGYNWLSEVHRFTCLWSPAQLEEMRGWTSVQYEDVITKLQDWVYNVGIVERSYVTRNRLILVDSSALQDEIIPALNAINQQILELLLSEAKQRAEKFVKDLLDLMDFLHRKNLTINIFANYTCKLEEYKGLTSDFYQQMEYVRSLNEVVRMNFRPLEIEEETYEDTMMHTWEAFLLQLKEASDFVRDKTSHYVASLNEAFQKLSKELERLVATATTGQFLDPFQNAAAMMQELMHMDHKRNWLSEQLCELSRSYGVITGKPFDMQFLVLAEKHFECRVEVWKLACSVRGQLEEWRRLPFSKFNATYAQEKVTEWLKVVFILEKSYPHGDKVLQDCMMTLHEFNRQLPMLETMTRQTLNHNHWKAILSGMDEVYNPDKELTVADLLYYSLADHKDLICQMCSAAKLETVTDQVFRKLQKSWQAKEFHLSKFIFTPKNRCPSAESEKKISSGKKKEKEEVQVDLDSGTLVLTNLDFIRQLTEESIETLNTLVSSHLRDNSQEEVNNWVTMFQLLEVLLGLWKTYQQNWILLTNLFQEVEIRSHYPELYSRFKLIDRNYRAIMQVTLHDPFVLSAVDSQRNTHRKKEFQGEELQKLMAKGISVMEEMIPSLDVLLDFEKEEFPRMHFLSPSDFLALQFATANPSELMPFVRKCFQNVQQLDTEPLNDNSELPTQDQRVVVKAVIGLHGESIPFKSPLTVEGTATGWLCRFEKNLRESLFHAMRNCITERLLMNKELRASSGKRYSLSFNWKDQRIPVAVENWLKLAATFPFQCVLVAEEVAWCNQVEETLLNRPKELKLLQTTYMNLVKSIIHFIQDCNTSTILEDLRTQLLSQALVTIKLYHRDIISKIVDSKTEFVTSFEWEKILKYRVGFDYENIAQPLKKSEREASFGSSKQKIKQIRLEHGCYVDILSSKLCYDYEYIGPSSWMICTPLTERSILGLVLALESYSCATVIGPCGTGKTETISHLAKALGRLLFTVKVFEKTDVTCISRLLCGAIQAGAWLVLDSVELMSEGTLSVLGQLLANISHSCEVLARKRKTLYSCHAKQVSKMKRHASIGTLMEENESADEDHPPSPRTVRSSTNMSSRNRTRVNWSYDPINLGSIIIEGNIIPARLNYGCFLVFRSLDSSVRIPENLRLLLRPVSMIQPDIKAIIEAVMYGLGFIDVPHFAEKIVTFFELAKSLGCLNSSSHLLIMKTILSAAASFVHQTLKTDDQPQEPSEIKKKDGHCEEVKKKIQINLEKEVIPDKTNKPVKAEKENLTNPGKIAKETIGSKTDIEKMERPKKTGNHLQVQEKSSGRRHPSVSLVLEDERAVIKAISLSVLSDCLKQNALKELMREIFPVSSALLPETALYSQLVSAVNQELLEEGLIGNSEVIANILKLFQVLQMLRVVIVTGPPGCGKTVLLKTLANALNRLAFLQREKQKDQMNEHKLDKANHSQEENHVQDVGRATSPSSQEFSIVVDYSSVSTSVIYPNSISMEELLGTTDRGVWKDGILTRLIRNPNLLASSKTTPHSASSKSSVLKDTSLPDNQHWIIIDGQSSLAWHEPISSLLDTHPFLSLSSGEHLRVLEPVNFIFEVTDLSDASPSVVTRSCLICLNGEGTWRLILSSMLANVKLKYTVTQETVNMWQNLSEDLFSATLEFIQESCASVLDQGSDYETLRHNRMAYGTQEVSCFKNVFHAFLNIHMTEATLQKSDVKQETPDVSTDKKVSQHSAVSVQKVKVKDILPANHEILAKNIFTYAYIWGFGGHLHPRFWPQFDLFVRQALLRSRYSIEIPAEGTVFDYCIEPADGTLQHLRGKYLKKLQEFIPQGFTPLPQYEKYVYILDQLLNSSNPVLLAGDPGCGKTSLLKDLICITRDYQRLPISRNITPSYIRLFLEKKVLSIRPVKLQLASRSLSTASKKTFLLLLEDLHTTSPDPCGRHHPVLETIRLSISSNGFYHNETLQFKHFVNVNIGYLATVTPHQGRANHVPSRLTRLFTVLALPALTKDFLTSVYTPVILNWLKQFTALYRQNMLCNCIIGATVDVYNAVKENFIPSPSRPHFLFSFHEIHKVLNGLFLMAPLHSIALANTADDLISLSPALMSQPQSKLEKTALLTTKTIVHLWLHESLRIFCDRLLNEQEKHTFTDILAEIARNIFCTAAPSLKVSSGATDLQKEEKQGEADPDAQVRASVEAGSRIDSACPSETPNTQQSAHSDSTNVPTDKDTGVGAETRSKSVVSDLHEVRTNKSINNTEELKCRKSLRSTKETPVGTEARQTGITLEEDDEDEDDDDEDDDDDDDETEDESSITESCETSLTAATILPSQSIRAPAGKASLRKHESKSLMKGTISSRQGRAIFQPSPPKSSVSTESSASQGKYQLSRRSKLASKFKESLSYILDQNTSDPSLYPELLSLNREWLLDLIFSRDMIPAAYNQRAAKLWLNPYQEKSMGTLTHQLSRLFQDWNQRQQQKLEVMFIKETVQHVARIFRTLLMSRGHGILLRLGQCMGRKTLIKMVAHLAHSEVLEIKGEGVTRSEANELLKKACYEAGALGNSVVLLVHEGIGDTVMNDVLSIMAEGTYPGLYSDEEMVVTIEKFLEVNSNIKRSGNSQIIKERFLAAVQRNLHIQVLWDLTGWKLAVKKRKTTSGTLDSLLGLLKQCCNVDLYQPWSPEALTQVAVARLIETSDEATQEGEPLCFLANYSSMLLPISTAMSMIHQSAERMAKNLTLATKTTYLDFIDFFKFTFKNLEEQNRLAKYRLEVVLSKMNEVIDRAEELRKLLEEEREELDKAQKHQSTCHQKLEAEKEMLKQVEQQCHQEELLISHLNEQLAEHHAQIENSFEKFKPVYSAALAALQALDVYDVEEIRSYRVPPAPVVMVTNVLCLMFGRPECWESAKHLIGQANFFQNLEFYNKDHISSELFMFLSDLVRHPLFQPEYIREASRAAESLCLWIHAVFKYAYVKRQLDPIITRRQEVENTTVQAQSRLGKIRVLTEKLILQIEVSETQYQEAVQQWQEISREADRVARIKEETNSFLQLVSVHISDWTATAKELEEKSIAAPGNAILLAAAITYMGPFTQSSWDKLLDEWAQICHTGQIKMPPEDLRKHLLTPPSQRSTPSKSPQPLEPSPAIPVSLDFSLIALLSSQEEQVAWHHAMLPSNAAARIGTLLLRSTILYGKRQWPLLLDPDGQAGMWVNVIQQSRRQELDRDSMSPCPASPGTEEGAETTQQAPEDSGLPIDGVDELVDKDLISVLKSFTLRPRNNLLVLYGNDSQLDLKLLSAAAKEFDPAFLKLVRVVDLSINQLGLEDLLLKEIVQVEKPEYNVQSWSLQTEHLKLELQLRQEQDSLLEMVFNSSSFLVQDESIIPMVLSCQNKMASLWQELSNLEDLQKKLTNFHRGHKNIAKLGAAVFQALEQVSSLVPLYHFPKITFLRVVKKALKSKRGKGASSGDTGDPKARLAELTSALLHRVYQHFRPFLFEGHAMLFGFLMAVAQMKLSGQVAEIEWEIFLHGLRDIQSWKDKEEPDREKPAWVSQEVWQDCTILETLPPFQKLKSSLIGRAAQWNEYFNLSSTVIGPPPFCNLKHLSIFQKAIVWRIFRPERLWAVIRDVTICQLGGAIAEDSGSETHSIFSYSCPHVPVVFLLPTQGTVRLSTHPVCWIKQMAKEHQMENNIREFSMGSPSQKEELTQLLRKCQSEGHWLVLNNCHLSGRWNNNVIAQLTELMATAAEENKESGSLGEEEEEEEEEEEVKMMVSSSEDRLDTLNNSETFTDSSRKTRCSFRLWLITRAEAGDSIPAVVRLQGVKLVCETPGTLKSALNRSYREAVSKASSMATPGQVIAVAVLHAVLLHRQLHGVVAQGWPSKWSQSDLYFALRLLEKVDCLSVGRDSAFSFLTGAVVYGGHVLDAGDANAVLSLSEQCLTSRSALLPSRGVQSLVFALTGGRHSALSPVESTQKDVEWRISMLPTDSEPTSAGLSSGMELSLLQHRSQALIMDLVALHWPQQWRLPLGTDTKERVTASLIGKCLGQVAEMQDFMETWAGMEIPKDTPNTAPMQCFLEQEWSAFKNMLAHLLSDLQRALDVLQGAILFNTVNDDIIEALTEGHLPSSWTRYTSDLSQQPLQYLQRLMPRLQLLEAYLNTSSPPVMYNLSAFQNPKAFLVLILREYSKKEHRDLSHCELKMQVLSGTLPPTTPPESGVYLTGLNLHNALWDTRLGILQETLSDKPCQLPTVWITAVTSELRATTPKKPIFPQYICPIYMGTASRDVSLKDSDVITHVPLPSKVDPAVCMQRRVHLISSA
nr:PREDICTED: dynein heavy chain domain-containing protein 1 isoform X2 [Latimeria chalumnae]|eukprot:XP_014353005.1 PREDICTED: dynein heavy chain domain-containing protein 1 isoform X2 [Latimeria chalumnae]